MNRRDDLTSNYTSPPFPSLFWPPDSVAWKLERIEDIWRFTLQWTLIIYAIFHVGAAGIALLMQVGKKKSNWKYLWMVPILYLIVAGVEALFAGSVVGLMYVAMQLTWGIIC